MKDLKETLEIYRSYLKSQGFKPMHILNVKIKNLETEYAYVLQIEKDLCSVFFSNEIFENEDFMINTIAHESIHTMYEDYIEKEEHGKNFQTMAKLLNEKFNFKYKVQETTSEQEKIDLKRNKND